MTKRNRSTLKNYFSAGMMPNEEHFSDLIDSCFNQMEDGFEKDPNAGLKLTARKRQPLLSFYRQIDPDTPLWKIGFAENTSNLQIIANQPVDITSNLHSNEKLNPSPTITLTSSGNMGIHVENPQHTLEVAGTIASSGRVGTQLVDTKIPADGQWHDITPELSGCHMFDVVAGIGIRHSGRYALLRATAINTFAPRRRWWHWLLPSRNPITTHQAYFQSSADKLKLRWKHKNETGTNRPYVLQIRSNTSYGENQCIRYHLTELWHDPFMDDCLHRPSEEQL